MDEFELVYICTQPVFRVKLFRFGIRGSVENAGNRSEALPDLFEGPVERLAAAGTDLSRLKESNPGPA